MVAVFSRSRGWTWPDALDRVFGWRALVDTLYIYIIYTVYTMVLDLDDLDYVSEGLGDGSADSLLVFSMPYRTFSQKITFN